MLQYVSLIDMDVYVFYITTLFYSVLLTMSSEKNPKHLPLPSLTSPLCFSHLSFSSPSLNSFPLPASKMWAFHNVLFPGRFYLPTFPWPSHISVDDSHVSSPNTLNILCHSLEQWLPNMYVSPIRLGGPSLRKLVLFLPVSPVLAPRPTIGEAQAMPAWVTEWRRHVWTSDLLDEI